MVGFSFIIRITLGWNILVAWGNYSSLLKTLVIVVNAAFLFFETSKLWVLFVYFVDRWKAEGLR